MLGVLAAVLAAGLLAGLGAHAVMTHPSSCPQPIVAQVAVSNEFAPVTERLGTFFNRQHRMVNGHCEQVAVRAAAPASVAARLAGGRTSSRQPAVDAWIPDSQLWVDVARATPGGASRVPATAPVIARTALLIAMPRKAAAQLPAFGSSVGWNFLLPQSAGGPSAALGLNVRFPDPTQSAAGLTALVEFRKLLGYGRPGRFALARFAFTVQVVPTPQRGGPSLASLGQPPSKGGPAKPVTVTTEQAVVRYDAAHAQQPLAIRYPAQGTSELAFPYLVTATSHANATVAAAFGTVLQSGYATALVRYEGFRTGTGQAGDWPIAYGLDQQEPQLLPEPGPNQAGAALRAWHQMSLGERLLALNDISSSMAVKPAPGGPTLEKMLGHAASLGIAHFPDSTQMGLWVFASHLPGSVPYRQLVSLGPLPGPFGLVTRRQAIAHLAASAVTVDAGASLYASILAAYRQMVNTYQPQKANAVIVLTAGVDTPQGDISSATLLGDLKALYNPSQPVNVVVIMIGQAGNFHVMQQIAAATNGKAYDITSPTQIRQVFFHAMGRRICQPHCPPGR